MAPKRDSISISKRQATWRQKEWEIRGLIREDRFELLSHVYDRIATNYWTYEDVVRSIATGAIQKAQKDELDEAVDGKKYTILGSDCSGQAIETVGKIVADEEGRLYLVITAY